MILVAGDAGIGGVITATAELYDPLVLSSPHADGRKLSAMRRKHWLVFGMVQAMGIIATLAAVFSQFPSLLLVPLIMLLPGSLVSGALFERGHARGAWSLTAIAVIANALLFTVTSFLILRHRKSK